MLADTSSRCSNVQCTSDHASAAAASARQIESNMMTQMTCRCRKGNHQRTPGSINNAAVVPAGKKWNVQALQCCASKLSRVSMLEGQPTRPVLVPVLCTRHHCWVWWPQHQGNTNSTATARLQSQSANTLPSPTDTMQVSHSSARTSKQITPLADVAGATANNRHKG